MTAKEQLKEYKEAIDVELKKFLDEKVAEAEKLAPHAKEIVEHVTDLTMRGGKRIRPALAYYSYIACGGKNKKEMLRVSMAIELSETYLLIHDDIMDSADLRRGGITVHESYRHMVDEKYPNTYSSKDFGYAMGVLAGDLACALSNEILACSKFKSSLINRALIEFNRVYSQECYGQTLDLFSQVEPVIKHDDVILTHQLKTVPYTFDGPVRIGAILAGANERQLEKLSQYSVPLGTAFQIQDDILGMFGSEEKLGKAVTSDLREGKKTLLIIDALEAANKEQREIIRLNLGNLRATYAGLRSVRKVITATGALEKSKHLAEELVQSSMEALSNTKLKKEGREFLVNIAEYMIKREY